MNYLDSKQSYESLPAEKSGCGIKPNKEALEQGFGIDFSSAKTLLDQEKDKTNTQEEVQKP